MARDYGPRTRRSGGAAISGRIQPAEHDQSQNSSLERSGFASRSARGRSAKRVIKKLTRTEADLLGKVDAAVGLIEEKTASLQAAGVFEAYAKVHRQYVNLVGDPCCGIEALKRALFIQWYAVSEPACFTGICDIDTVAQTEVFQALDEMTQSAQLDFELRYMLLWYHQISDWYFDNRTDIPNLRQWFAATPHELPRFNEQDLNGRGQMARYWQSLTFEG